MNARHKTTLPLVLAAVTAATPTALASTTLTMIPLFYEGTYGEYQNEGRAITPDGAFVVGVEYASNTVYRAWMDGVFYNVSNHTVVSPLSDSSPPRILTGIGYRTSGGQKQIVVAGYDQANFVQSEWMTANGGQTWGAIRRNTSFTECINPATANSLGSAVASDKYYVIVGSADTRTPGAINDQRHLYTGLGSGTWPATMNLNNQYFAVENPDAGNWCGVAATGTAAGRAIGWYRDNPWAGQTWTATYNCIGEYPPAGPSGGFAKTWFFNGLNNMITNGEAWAVSADGTKIFGRSATSFDTNWHGYKAIVGTSMYSWVRTDRLPDFSNTAGSPMLACPYGCTADGRYAVGMNYRGTERAVIWDTGDANPTNWTVVDLTDLAAAEGILTGGWERLARAYSVGTNVIGEPVITGYGAYTDGSGTWNRAFVMTVSRCALVANAAAITTPVYDTATTVTVTNCNPVATTIKIYHESTQIGSAAGGMATVVVTVAPPSLVAGWVLKVTQTVNGQESCLSTAPGIVVTTPANPPPVVVLTAPTNNASFVAPANISLSATVTSNFNTINYVRFYSWGTNLIGNVTSPPYTTSWAGVAAGTYSISARVGYNSGSSVDSGANWITVALPWSGSSLTPIPLPSWTYELYNSQGRAITCDGRYVAGPCYGSSPGDGSAFLFDVPNGILIQPSANSHPDQQYLPNLLTGIGYRTSSSRTELILDGMSDGYQANWMTADGGVTWGAVRMDVRSGFLLPTANSLAAMTGSDKFYAVIGNYAADINNQRELHILKGSGAWNSSSSCAMTDNWFYIDNPDAGNLCGVAATGAAAGRAVGWYRDAPWAGQDWTDRWSCVVDYPPPGSIGYPASYAQTWFLKGLASTNTGEAWSISADGTKIFGRSPTPTDENWHGYKAVVGTGTNSLQAGYPKQLPDFPDTGGSTRLATPYGCSADGRYAVGMNYRGAERAVLWDTGDSNPSNWKVMDLTERAASEGILGGFAVLMRALSVGTDSAGNPVVTGYGWHYDGTRWANRAFVMVVGTATSARPRITSIAGAGAGSVTVYYTNTLAGTNYTLQYNTNLGTTNWHAAGTKTATGTGDSQPDAAAANGQRFYRIYRP